MTDPRWKHPSRLALLLFAVAMIPACDRSPLSMLRTNELPTVTISPQVVPPRSQTLRVSWKGEDVDGRVAHYRVALDPASLDKVDESWRRTSAITHVVDLSPYAAERGDARKLHRFAVRAVDDAGAMSASTWMAFYGDNIPPSVHITNPLPSVVTVVPVGPTLPIRWEGVDPDGVFTTHPVKYKFKLIPDFDPEYLLFIADPDSIRRLYSPTYAGWDSVSGDSTNIRYTNLLPGRQYMFVITAFDEAGDDDVVFNLNKNMLRVRVYPAGVLGPRFTVFNDFFNYTYATGGDFAGDPVSFEIPSSQPVEVQWFALPPEGTQIAGYRYAFDPVDPEDDSSWSPWSLANTLVTLGPFPPNIKRQKHRLYLEAMDSVEGVTRVQVALIVVTPTFAGDLLVVNDTRYEPDKVLAGQTCPTLPTGPWPVASELDTFLFARGNVDWRCQGTIMPVPKTKPGLFSAYRPETLGTRTRIRYLRTMEGGYGPAGNPVPLSVLNQFSHVVWLTDGLGASYTSATDPIRPATALRYMNAQNQMNTLGAYVKQGGKLWLAGGGAGYAAGISFNDRINDSPTVTFSSITSTRGELQPGRFMYDWTHWQSEYRNANAAVTIRRALGRYDSAGVSPPPYAPPPMALEMKTPASDPRTEEAPTRSSSAFYQSTLFMEFLQEPNSIIEDLDPGLGVDEQSTLDTLYRATGAQLFKPVQHVPMTYYHGPNNTSVVFSGFPFWNFKRTQGQALVDFVLRDLWGLTPSAPAPVATRDP